MGALILVALVVGGGVWLWSRDDEPGPDAQALPPVDPSVAWDRAVQTVRADARFRPVLSVFEVWLSGAAPRYRSLAGPRPDPRAVAAKMVSDLRARQSGPPTTRPPEPSGAEKPPEPSQLGQALDALKRDPSFAPFASELDQWVADNPDAAVSDLGVHAQSLAANARANAARAGAQAGGGAAAAARAQAEAAARHSQQASSGAAAMRDADVARQERNSQHASEGAAAMAAAQAARRAQNARVWDGQLADVQRHPSYAKVRHIFEPFVQQYEHLREVGGERPNLKMVFGQMLDSVERPERQAMAAQAAASSKAAREQSEADIAARTLREVLADPKYALIHDAIRHQAGISRYGADMMLRQAKEEQVAAVLRGEAPQGTDPRLAGMGLGAGGQGIISVNPDA